jgi:hypothetical protein
MKRNIVYLVDDDAPARRANTQALRRLLDTRSRNCALIARSLNDCVNFGLY